MQGPAGDRERAPPPAYQSVTVGQSASSYDCDYVTHDPPPTSYHDSSTLLVRRAHPDRDPGCPSTSGCPPPPSTLHHPDREPGCPPTSPPPSSLHDPVPDQPMPPSPQVSPPATSHVTDNADDIVELPDDTDKTATGRQENGQGLTDQQRTDDDLRMDRNLGDRPGGQAGEAEDGGAETRGDVPNTHLLMACLVCLCFNLPLGIVAMYLSLRAAQAFRAGHDKLGLRRSRCSVLVSLLAIAVTTVIVSSVVFYMATQGHKRISRQRAYGTKSGLSL